MQEQTWSHALLDSSALRDLLSKRGFSLRDKLLLCLATDPDRAMPVKEVRDLAVSAGLRSAKTSDLSTPLSRAKTLVARTAVGWELTSDGKAHVAELAGPFLPSVTPLVLSSLRNHLSLLHDKDTKSFIEEAIKCFESKLYRSSIVFTWIGAVSVMHKHVHGNFLSAFNSEALRRDPKWRAAKTVDDIARLKEFDFLQVIHSISLIGKNVKDELEVCLKLRNGCGHPNSLQVGEHKASAHIETLIQNVFAKF